MSSLSDIIAGVECDDVTKPSLIYSLAKLQNENDVKHIKNARKWISEMETILAQLKKKIDIVEYEIQIAGNK